MPVNVFDASDSYLKGRAEYNDWADKFMASWYKPAILMLMAAAVKEAGTTGMLQNPEAVIKTDQLVKRLTGRSKYNASTLSR